MEDWEKAVLNPNATIKEAIVVLNHASLRIVLICNEEKQLLGVVSDGDIRRGILANFGLNDCVSNIMNKKPFIGTDKQNFKELLAIMERENLLQIPIVKDGKLVGLETIHHIISQKRLKNPIFIMAGGFGTRLKPFTDNCPKPLLKVGGKPILETILESFIEHGFQNFYISTHYLPEKIKDYFGDGSKWNVNIRYVHEESPLGTGGALGLLPADIPKLPLIMINGDVLTKVNFKNLLDFHNSLNPIATMCVSEYEFQVPYGVIQSENERLIKIIEKPKYRSFINAGIYVVSQELLNKVQKNEKIDMPTLLQNSVSSGYSVATFPLHEHWLDIGQKSDFSKAQADFEQYYSSKDEYV